MTLRTTRNTVSHGPSRRAFILLAALTAGMGLSRPAFGFPKYSIKEGKDCRYCHIAGGGGGPTNARGRYYAEHLSFEGYMEKKAPKPHQKKPRSRTKKK